MPPKDVKQLSCEHTISEEKAKTILIKIWNIRTWLLGIESTYQRSWYVLE